MNEEVPMTVNLYLSFPFLSSPRSWNKGALGSNYTFTKRTKRTLHITRFEKELDCHRHTFLSSLWILGSR